MNQSRLNCIFAAIDQKNQQDPNLLPVDDKTVPKEHLYVVRMSECLQQFKPDASENLQIACRAQHIQRWKIARTDYPMNRVGYRRWRTELGRFHAETTAELMGECGYPEADRIKVMDILQKKRIKQDAETQTMEDVACLVFLQHYLDDFARRHPDDKVVDIIRKTWQKMSAEGHAAALQTKLPDHLAKLVQQALA
ncbi:MAG: DUF4202 domain-containing protein [Gammaproteobacteria bacterium]|nr:DUF4202 domain-containing protein [Gammaproteobacteria bacterium]